MKKEQEKELNSKIPTITCACGFKLQRDDVNVSQVREIFYRVSYDDDGTPEDYEEIGNDSYEDERFYCSNCGRVLNEEQLNKLKINY